MAYLKNRTARAAKKRGFLARLGLGDAGNCGAADQLWYPNLTFNGITGQCSTPAAAQAALASGVATGNLSQSTAGTYTPSGPSVTEAISKFFGGLLSGATAAPAAPAVVQQHGMSTTTKVALAGGAVLLLALIARK